MKKIAMVGLYSIPNMGDQILCEAAQFLAKKIDPNIDIVEVDVCPRYKSDYKGYDYIKYRISRKMKTIGENRFTYENNSSFRYRYEFLMWRIRLNRYYKKILADADAIIFAGGGFLKFRTQGLNYYVEMIIDIAAKKNIPVMMNGVGIEGYDENDIRCQKLKETVNRDCVKVITTRDDVDTLQKKYITNPEIETARVGDVAFWTPECYNVTKNQERSTIGINIIRGKVFKDYGNTYSYNQLKGFYKDLVKQAEERNLDWVFFSNGMEEDQEFGSEILNEMGLDIPEKLLPAPETSMDLLNMIKSFQCIFGARLHACITAYSLDVPVVGFIWNEKTRIFADMIGKADHFFEESDIDENKILDCLAASSEGEYDKSIRDHLKALTEDYMSRFLKQI